MTMLVMLVMLMLMLMLVNDDTLTYCWKAGEPCPTPAGTGLCSSKGLALDLLFLKAQSRFILHQPMRIPVVDSTANSAQARWPLIPGLTLNSGLNCQVTSQGTSSS